MDWKNLKIKDKIAHEAIKEHWQEHLESEIGIQNEKSLGVQHHLNVQLSLLTCINEDGKY